jgi:tetratricopeptide (TPR) repeat protein
MTIFGCKSHGFAANFFSICEVKMKATMILLIPMLLLLSLLWGAPFSEGGGSYAFEPMDGFDTKSQEEAYIDTLAVYPEENDDPYYGWDYDQITDHIEKLNQDPSNQQILIDFVETLLEKEYYGLAWNLVQSAKLLYPEARIFDKHLGLIYLNHFENQDSARACLDSYLEAYPEDAQSRYRLALLEQDLGNETRAMQHFSYIVDHADTYDEHWIETVSLLADKYEEAANHPALVFLVESVLAKEIDSGTRYSFILRGIEAYFNINQAQGAESLCYPYLIQAETFKDFDDRLLEIRKYYWDYGFQNEFLSIVEKLATEDGLVFINNDEDSEQNFDILSEGGEESPIRVPITTPQKYVADHYLSTGEYSKAIPIYIKTLAMNTNVELLGVQAFFRNTEAMLILAYHKMGQSGKITASSLEKLSEQDFKDYGFYFNPILIKNMLQRQDYLAALKHAASKQNEYLFASFYVVTFGEKLGITEARKDDFWISFNDFFEQYALVYEALELPEEAVKIRSNMRVKGE